MCVIFVLCVGVLVEYYIIIYVLFGVEIYVLFGVEILCYLAQKIYMLFGVEILCYLTQKIYMLFDVKIYMLFGVEIYMSRIGLSIIYLRETKLNKDTIMRNEIEFLLLEI